jgi:hypothetical protein
LKQFWECGEKGEPEKEQKGPPSEADFREFMKWLASNQCKLNGVEFHQFSEGFGVKALKDLKEGDLVIKVKHCSWRVDFFSLSWD